MTDLRKKIVEIFCEWNEDETAESVADRILDLLPKIPGFRWDGAKLKLGKMLVGRVYKAYDPNPYSGTLWDRVVIRDVSEAEARAAVEAAVRKVLGWEDVA